MMESIQVIRNELPVMLFEEQQSWADWLDENQAASPGVWLRLAKKGSDLKSVSYAEAVEVALCYGWIDGQAKSYDSSSWLQKFTRRGLKSLWSKINREKVEELIRNNRMKPAGLEAVERARQDGRWDSSYDSPSRATIPVDFQAALDRNEPAKAFFATLDSRNRYAFLFRIQTARKAETRARRIEQYIKMLEKNEKLYP